MIANSTATREHMSANTGNTTRLPGEKCGGWQATG